MTPRAMRHVRSGLVVTLTAESAIIPFDRCHKKLGSLLLALIVETKNDRWILYSDGGFGTFLDYLRRFYAAR